MAAVEIIIRRRVSSNCMAGSSLDVAMLCVMPGLIYNFREGRVDDLGLGYSTSGMEVK